MSIWSRMAEAIAALAKGEPLSAVFDKLRARPDRTVGFAIAVIALGAKMAKADGTELSENHWEVINFLREYYEEYQIAPAVRVLTKAIGKKLGKDKGNSKYLYELFPYGPAKQACKYAGLPKPTGCV